MKFFRSMHFVLFIIYFFIFHNFLSSKSIDVARQEAEEACKMIYREAYENIKNNGHETNAPEILERCNTSSDFKTVCDVINQDFIDRFHDNRNSHNDDSSYRTDEIRKHDFINIIDTFNNNANDFSTSHSQENNFKDSSINDYLTNPQQNNSDNSSSSNLETRDVNTNNDKFDWNDQRRDSTIDSIRDRADSNQVTSNIESISLEKQQRIKTAFTLLNDYEQGKKPFEFIEDLAFFLKYKGIDLKKDKFEYGKYPEIKMSLFYMSRPYTKVTSKHTILQYGKQVVPSKDHWYKITGKSSVDQFSQEEIIRLFLDLDCYKHPTYLEFLKDFPAYNFFINYLVDSFSNPNHIENKYRDLCSHFKRETFKTETSALKKLEEQAQIAVENWIKDQTDQSVIKKIYVKHDNQALIEEFKNEKLTKDKDLTKFHDLRIDALKSENLQITDVNYSLTPLIKNFLQSNSFDTKLFENLIGNQIQHQCHKEILHIIEQSADVWSNTKSEEIKDITKITANFANLGAHANKDGLTNFTYLCIDAGHCFLAFAKGAGLALLKNGEFLKDVVFDPIKAGTQVTELAKNVVYATGKVFCFLLEPIVDSTKMLIDPEYVKTVEEKWDSRIKLTKQIYRNTCDYFANATKEELLENAGFIIADLFFNAVVLPNGVSKFASLSKETLAISAVNGKQIFEKLGTVGKESARVIGLAVKNKPHAVSEAIDTLKLYPHLLKNSISQSVENTVENINHFKNYIQINAEYLKTLATNEKLRNFHEKFKIPNLLMFDVASTVPLKLHDLGPGIDLQAKFYYFVDKLGNKIKVPFQEGKSTVIEFSQLGNKTLNWMNDKNRPKVTSQQLNKQINSPPIKNITIAVNTAIHETADAWKQAHEVIKPILDTAKEGSKGVWEYNGTLKEAKKIFNELAITFNTNHLIIPIPNNGGFYFTIPGTEDAITFRPFSKTTFPTINIKKNGEITKIKFKG